MTSMPILLVLTCVILFIAGVFLTLRVRSLAESLGTLDLPNERSSHTTPTPRGGGLSFVVLTLSMATYVAMTSASISFGAYVLCGLGVAVVSLVDDIRSVPPGMRLGVHIAAAGAFVLVSNTFAVPALVIMPALVLWIVSLTNIFNFMDGIDGIAASQGVITLTAMGTYALLNDDSALALVCLAAAFSTAGFLVINWPPARIFMGDIGSAFLGFSCGCLSLISGDPGLWLVTLFASWPFVFDASATLCRRIYNRENILRSHRSHFYQRLVISGYSHSFVTSVYVVAALCSAAAGFAAHLSIVPLWSAFIAIGGLSFSLLLFVYRAGRRARVRSM